MKANKQNNNQESEFVVSILTKKYESELAQKDEEIAKLKDRIELLKNSQKNISKKKESISNALVAAVDKAKDIEQSSKKVYELKINQLIALQTKWEKLLGEMLEKHPDMVETANIANMVETFKQNMLDALSNDFGHQKNAVQTSSSGDQIRLLLDRMNSKTEKKETVIIERKKNINNKSENTVNMTKPKKVQEKKQVDKVVSEDIPTMIKPIADITIDKNENFETLADKFLNDNYENDVNSGFAKAIYSKKSKADPYAFPDVNESGFDLEQAVNPTEELDEIMKSFDFYQND